MKILLDGRVIADIPTQIVGPGDQIYVRFGEGKIQGHTYFPRYNKAFLVLDVWRPLLHPARDLVPEVVNVIEMERVWQRGGCFFDRETNLLIFDDGEEGVPL